MWLAANFIGLVLTNLLPQKRYWSHLSSFITANLPAINSQFTHKWIIGGIKLSEIIRLRHHSCGLQIYKVQEATEEVERLL